MGLRFQRRIRLFKGVYLNLSKTGASVSLRGRGGGITVGKRGPRASVGIPGTGLSYQSKLGSGGGVIGVVVAVIAAVVILAQFV